MLSDLENLNNLLRKARTLSDKQAQGEADKIMQRAHLFVHRKWRLHFRLHWSWMKMGLRRKSMGLICKQIFPVLFALPVSFFHRRFNLAMSRHQTNGDY